MKSDLVRYSRAGDVFHYRWAARRCLRMIDPLSGLDCITVEASKDRQLPGELAIDIAEYSGADGENPTVAYRQLKHSCLRVKAPFTISELSRTLGEFAERFRAEERRPRRHGRRRHATFSIVTNRAIHVRLKNTVLRIGAGEKVQEKDRQLLEQATRLRSAQLTRFCKVLMFEDREDDYRAQRRKLHGELSSYLVGFVDSAVTRQLVDLVEDRALPQSEDGRVNGEIVVEDVLQRLRVTSRRQLFPAPPVFEPLASPIVREQHKEIVRHILDSGPPAIVHAAGGVGKTMVARLLADSLPTGSQAVLYDCFGGGTYRSPGEPRHTAQVALVQIANTLAARGLCSPLLPRPECGPAEYFQASVERLSAAVENLNAMQPGALLVVMIDAADNAEMAALEYGDRCFAAEFLRQQLPAGCRLVMFCRSERRELLQPASGIRQFQLKPFSEAESMLHLRRKFPNATDHDGREFFRLSGGNPRVQANAMNAGHPSLDAMLSSLGPNVTTIDKQIEGQLQIAVDRVKDSYSREFARHVDNLCRGLANLPPLIPIPVLATAARVTAAEVSSFISDLGTPLWSSEDAVQFRDEPTETWFQQRFAADARQITEYVEILEPLASEYTYVAKALPQLLLKSSDHDRLIALALSDSHLPTANPIDERDVRVYRLQFAFKAALKRGRLADAARIALRAGEESAGTKRQSALLRANLDLVAALQDTNRVQELACRQELKGGWEGCENLYSASLLSAVANFKGEARSYLRSATRWIALFFERLSHVTMPLPHSESELSKRDIFELAWAHYHLFGSASLAESIKHWRPLDMVFDVVKLLAERLIDAGRFKEIDQLLEDNRCNTHVVLALVDELNAVARLPQRKYLAATLQTLASPRWRPKRPAGASIEKPLIAAVLSFLEACAAHALPRRTILRALTYYTPTVANTSMDSDHSEAGRETFLRGVTLRSILVGKPSPELDALLPKSPKRKDARAPASRQNDLRRKLGVLLPWHHARMMLVTRRPGSRVNLEAAATNSRANQASYYQDYDRMPRETAAIRFCVLAWKKDATTSELEAFARETLRGRESKLWLYQKIDALRVSVRTPHLARLREPLEAACNDDLAIPGHDTPEERAESLTSLARALWAQSPADAKAHFSNAIDAVSKFGDEMLDRWTALTTLARRAASSNRVDQLLVHRFVRCAEMIGESVAREKHWNRDDVFLIAAELDSSFALAALSRWRDREIGFFPSQMQALTTSLVEQKLISPSVGYSLSAFFEGATALPTISACLRGIHDPHTCEKLLTLAIDDLQLAGIDKHDWEKLRALTHELKLPTEQFDHIIHAAPKSRYWSGESIPRTRRRVVRKDPCITSLFKGVDLLAPGSLRRLLAEAKAAHASTPMEIWKEFIPRIPPGQEAAFLSILIEEQSLDLYDFTRALDVIRPCWMQKASVKRAWPSFLRDSGRRFAEELLNVFRWEYWRQDKGFSPDEIEAIRLGTIERLSDSTDLFDAETLFGFAAKVTADLTPDEAATVLDYALERFERHMPAGSGDAPWSNSLHVPADVASATAGLVWSALASPEAATRWQAAHCTRRFVELGCQPEIDALLSWMQRGTVAAFGSQQLPFYRLHGELYLLIAFARTVEGHEGMLRRHAAYFAGTALHGSDHVLIQGYASRIALAIETAFPGTYPLATAARLAHVGSSPFPTLEISKDTTFDSPAHTAGTVDTSIKCYFGMDFEEYWLSNLSDVFGIPRLQVTELVREIVARECQTLNSDGHVHDPRRSLWNKSMDRTFSGDRSSYGRTDDFCFYHAYHAMHAVAATLRRSMPVVHKTDRMFGDEGDPWAHWLKRHTLTRTDGRWLADRRDPSPTCRREWTAQSINHDFPWQLTASDFYDALHRQSPLPGSLCVHGFWADCDNCYNAERINIASALVPRETAEALAITLRDDLSRYDMPLPAYRDELEDEGTPPLFTLEGWLTLKDGGGERLDYFDPKARRIAYPPIGIGARFLSLLGLVADDESRHWHRSGNLVALGEIWSERPEVESRHHQSPYRSGRRLWVAVDVLQQLCAATGKDLIFSVALGRDANHLLHKPDFPYMPDSHKVFLFSANGRLRDAQKIHLPR